MLTVIETPMFLRYANKVWDNDERDEFVDWISDNPEAGDVIPGFSPLRKVRWSAQGKGKKGGARVIYFSRLANATVTLLVVYPKSKTEDLSRKFLYLLQEMSHE
ncbi:MAG: transcriptional regulator [Azoarcus sp.]|jgi:mRNA-degrading endonuclease RelE of RelBE toxin-antitoxin system|nr:transcriptional regulator [Azoarcus sp.]